MDVGAGKEVAKADRALRHRASLILEDQLFDALDVPDPSSPRLMPREPGVDPGGDPGDSPTSRPSAGARRSSMSDLTPEEIARLGAHRVHDLQGTRKKLVRAGLKARLLAQAGNRQAGEDMAKTVFAEQVVDNPGRNGVEQLDIVTMLSRSCPPSGPLIVG